MTTIDLKAIVMNRIAKSSRVNKQEITNVGNSLSKQVRPLQKIG